jgi:hypothetical protein
MVSTFLVTWPSNKKMVLVIKGDSSRPRLVKESNGTIILHLKGIKENLSYFSLESVVCQKAS